MHNYLVFHLLVGVTKESEVAHRVVYVGDQFFLSTPRLEFELSFDKSGAIAARKSS
jgi:hypothetical protein